MNFRAVVVTLLLTLPALTVADNLQQWKTLIRESQALHKGKQYDQAADKAAAALQLAERSFGGEDLKVSRSLRQLAYIYGYQRRYPESIPLLRRALRITQVQQGPNHPDVADAMSTLALHLGNNREREEAERIYQRAVAIRESTQGSEHLDLAYDLMALARYAQWRKDYQNAEALLERALHIRVKHLQPDHGWIAESWAALAQLYQQMQRHEAAVAAQSRAVAIKLARLGAEHPSTQGYQATLKRMQAALTRDGQDAVAPILHAEISRNRSATEEGRAPVVSSHAQTRSVEASQDSTVTNQRRQESRPPRPEERTLALRWLDNELDFRVLSREVNQLQRKLAQIDPFDLLFLLFIALLLWRAFRRGAPAIKRDTAPRVATILKAGARDDIGVVKDLNRARAKIRLRELV